MSHIRRKDTHKKTCFFSGRATNGVGRLTRPPPDTKQKNIFFLSINPAFLAQKLATFFMCV